jgi:hypothetical protein
MHRMPDFAVLVASRAVDAAAYRVEPAFEEYAGDEFIDFEAEAEAAMVAEVRQQLTDLDALAPYATRLFQTPSGFPAHEHQRLLAELRGIGGEGRNA